MTRDDVTLIDIDEAAKYAMSYVEGMTRQEFEADPKTVSAVLYEILIIGEATKRLSAEFRAAHLEIEWPTMAGMRDRLIHGYDDVNLDRVWTVLTVKLPELRERLAPLIPKETEEDR